MSALCHRSTLQEDGSTRGFRCCALFQAFGDSSEACVTLFKSDLESMKRDGKPNEREE